MNTDYYGRVHGFDARFGTAVSAALDCIEDSVAQGRGVGFVVEDAGRVAGSIFISEEAPGIGRIRLFLVRAPLQGCGLGRALLDNALHAGVEHGFDHVKVSTFSLHEAACALYRKAGFQEERRMASQAFGLDLIRVDFVRHGPG